MLNKDVDRVPVVKNGHVGWLSHARRHRSQIDRNLTVLLTGI